MPLLKHVLSLVVSGVCEIYCLLSFHVNWKSHSSLNNCLKCLTMPYNADCPQGQWHSLEWPSPQQSHSMYRVRTKKLFCFPAGCISTYHPNKMGKWGDTHPPLTYSSKVYSAWQNWEARPTVSISFSREQQAGSLWRCLEKVTEMWSCRSLN